MAKNRTFSAEKPGTGAIAPSRPNTFRESTPVIRSLYREFRHYGDQSISEKGTSYKSVKKPNGTFSYKIVQPSISHENQDDAFTRKLLDKIWEVYGKYSAIQLSNKTHEVGTPWYQISQEYAGKMPKGTDIPSEKIKEYFRKLRGDGASNQ